MPNFVPWLVSLLLVRGHVNAVCAEDCLVDDLEAVQDQVCLLQVSKHTSQESLTPQSLERSDDAYPWSQRGRDYTTSCASPYNAPTDLSVEPSWSWPNPDDEQVRHSPLIDNDNNIYVTTGYKMRKFDSNGTVQWALPTELQVSSPALYKGLMYGVEQGPTLNLFAVNMSTGAVTLNTTVAGEVQDGDASSIFVFNDTVLFAVMPEHYVYAANASDGKFLWKFTPDDVLWNFAPSADGHGAILFAGSCGRAFKLSFEGKLVWKAGPANSNHGSGCGTGGGSVGKNGVFYNEFNHIYPVTKDKAVTTSHLSAHPISDGQRLWTRDLNFKIHNEKGTGNQYPAVGEIQIGDSKRLAVVAALGVNPDKSDTSEPDVQDEWLPNAIEAMDAETGEKLWRYDQPKWAHGSAEGDTGERLTARTIRKLFFPKNDVMCLPDTQGIPAISGDGTVYMSSSTSGHLRAIKDKDGNGIIDPSEVSSFYTGNCFLNSPSIGKDMLVAAPCWGAMYVFKSS